MATQDPAALTRLLQLANRAEVECIGDEPWLTVYLYETKADGAAAYFCALVDPAKVPKVMSNDGWDLRIGSGMPGFSTSFRAGEKSVTTYHRFGDDDGIEPLVFLRSFDGLKPKSFELLEEFRHLFNLYHDRHNDRYIRLTDSGEDEVVAEVVGQTVRMRTAVVRQFLSVKQMNLAVFFDFKAFELGKIDVAPSSQGITLVRPDLRYSFHVGERLLSGKTFSRLLGKRIIEPRPIEESQVGPYREASRRFAEFIIGSDTHGNEISFSCDPEDLANYFGANPDAPHFLTPVVFRREVLKKYYDHPEKYEVTDGLVRCGGLWVLSIDNDSDDRVTVFLGDLGETLSYEEQIYWRSFNIRPHDDGKDLSETNIRRSFRAEFADPTTPELVLKAQFTEFQESWEKRFGWQLFRALPEGDAHVYQRLRLPVTTSMAEFEDQILNLTKLLIDSINDSALVQELGVALPDEKSISKLERFLTAKQYPSIRRDLEFLRLLQETRSSISAHRKGNSYKKLAEKLGLATRPPPEVFADLLKGGISLIDGLTAFFLQDKAGR